MTTATPAAPTKTVQRLIDRHAKLKGEFTDAYAAVETSDDAPDSPGGKKLQAHRDKAGERLHEVAEKLRAAGYALEHDDSKPVPPTPAPTVPTASPAKKEPAKPVALSTVKPTDDARLYLGGRKGYWLGRLVKHDAKTLTFRCKWHANDKEVKVDRADVARLEVKRGKAYVPVTL